MVKKTFDQNTQDFGFKNRATYKSHHCDICNVNVNSFKKKLNCIFTQHAIKQLYKP